MLNKRTAWLATTKRGVLAMALHGALAFGAADTASARQAQVQDEAREYAIAGQPLGAALHQFADASGLQIMIPPELVQGKVAPALNGRYPVMEGLRRLLAGSGLTYRTTQRGVVVIAAASPRAPSPPKAAPAAAAGSSTPGEPPVQALEQVTVTGSRLRSIVGEQEANPVLVFTREEIEQSGVTTLAELRNLIPQLSVGASSNFDGNSAGGTPEGRLLFDIRGLTPGNTLVLLDGIRLPMTGQRTVASAYEATGIPLSAVERVEVLLGGGSAIYGSDAVGGVVNIITRKNYQGTEIEFARDDTFDTDAANDRLSISHSFRKHGFTVRASASRETQNALARRDRWWLSSDDRRHIGGTDGTRNNLPIGGQVRSVDGKPLPGLDSSTAYIPQGADGMGATLEDYASAGPTPKYDSGKLTNALNEYVRENASLHVEYEFADWAQLYANYQYARNESVGIGAPPILRNIRLPADYPGNPFGVPILLDKYLWELGNHRRRYSLVSQSVQVGMRGALPKDWRYDFYLNDSRSTADHPETSWILDRQALEDAINGDDPPPLLNDSLNSPGSREFFESLLLPSAIRDTSVTKTASVTFDGPLFRLPAGPAKLAVGLERRTEAFSVSRDRPSAMEAQPPADDRLLNAQYAEFSLPVFSRDFRFPLLQNLTLSGAVRRDDYSDFGAATKPLMGVLYKPVPWLAFRASRNEAFRVPYLLDLTRPRSVVEQNVPATGSQSLIDTYRDNEPYVGPLKTTLGGNPDLKPENSVHHNYGILIESPFKGKWIEGLSFSVDRWESDILDRVGSLSRQEMLDYFPEAFERAELTPEDIAAGHEYGRIIGMEQVPRNIARYRAAGFDYHLRYRVGTGIGDFMLDAKATTTDRREAYVTPDSEPSASVTPLLSPTRVISTLGWQHRGMGASLSSIHQESFPVSAVSPEAYPSTLTWNTNVWYDFGTGAMHARGGLLDRLLGHARVSFGLINATNEEPPISSRGNVNGTVDPRLRRYTFTLRYSF